MKRRTFITAVVALMAGCLGYTRTTANDYELLNAGYTDGDAWLDVRYTGTETGRIQYRLFIEEQGVLVNDSQTQGKHVEPDNSYRLTASVDGHFDRTQSSVGFRLINPEGGLDENGNGLDVGRVSINK